MTAATFVGLIAGLWWAGAMLVLLLSFVAALCFPWPRRSARPTAELPPLTVIAPIKDMHCHFDETQSSLFAQSYPDIEIVVAAAEQESSAVVAARRIQGLYPRSSSRIALSYENGAASPKLNNLWPHIVQARDDLILTKDSNVLLMPDDVEFLVRQFEPGVGLVNTIPVASQPETFAAWVEAAIINGSYARMLMLARSIGLGFGCGKVMLFRRSDVEQAGGFESLAWALGEDAALADAMAGLGLRTVLAARVSYQLLGSRSLGGVWERQLRWKSIWRVQLPFAFVGWIFTSALLTAVAGAVAAPLLGVSSWAAAVATLGCWFVLETLLCVLKGWPVSLWSPIAFVTRELLGLLVWLRALVASEVTWAGNTYRLSRRESRPRPVASATPGLQQKARINDAF